MILSTPPVIGGLCGVFLDNIIEGTDAERGMGRGLAKIDIELGST